MQRSYPRATVGVERVRVSDAGQPHLALDSVLAESPPPTREVRSLDVEVLQPMDDEHTRLAVRGVALGALAIVSRRPDAGVRAGLVAVVGGHLLQSIAAVDIVCALTGDVLGQVRRVVVGEREALIPGVVVP